MIEQTFEELRLSGNLPSPSGVGMRILELTRTDDYETEDIAAAIKADSALTGRILKLANSGTTAGVQPATTAGEAIMRCGTRTVRDLALAFSLVSERRAGTCAAFDYERYWTKSLARAVSAQEICRVIQLGKPEEGYLCGLLGEIGKLAMASVFPDQYGEILVDPRVRERGFAIRAETERFSITHAEIGAFLFTEWGLPKTFADAVMEFSESMAIPDKVVQPGSLVAVLQFADMIAEILTIPDDGPEEAWLIFGDMLDELRALLKLEPAAFTRFCDSCVAEWIAWGKSLEIATETVRFAQVEARIGAARAAVAGTESHGPAHYCATDVRSGAPNAVQDLSENQQVRVLCIDDDPAARAALASYLSEAGYEVREAVDGKAGLKAALETNPDIVVASRHVSGLDGLELCRSLRQTEAGRRMYFLLATSSHEEESVVEAFEAGVDDYVVKPFIRRLLLARVHGGRRLAKLQHKVEKDKQTMMRQVAQLGMLTRQLRAVSLTDVLTELPNRRYAMKRLDTEWASTARTGRPMSLMMVDIDQFKKVNDGFGHDVGDVILRATAKTLRRCLRQSDEVCRIGGEEFLVICPNTNQEECLLVADRVRKTMEESVVPEPGFERSITISIGVAGWTADVPSVVALLKASDEAVYEAKAAGRNCVRAARLEAPVSHRQSA